MSYYLITADKDGIAIDVCCDEIDLEQRLKEKQICCFSNGFDEKCLREDDMWGRGKDVGIIIKGEVVMPTPKTVVKEWDFHND